MPSEDQNSASPLKAESTPATRRRVARIYGIIGAAALVCGVVAVWQWPRIDALVGVIVSRVGKTATVETRLAQYDAGVHARLAPFFQQTDVAYPPRRLTLIGLKQEKQLELWAGNDTGPMRYIKTYPVKAASGVSGPKLREGDKQVPEGIYTLESLNPNSRYHLALRVNYPNEFDRARALEEKRNNLGGDIMIHGKSVSVGCLAMGDAAAEELFILAARVDTENVRILLCPADFRVKKSILPPPEAPGWVAGLYQDLGKALSEYRQPEP
jgi:hypothetical protein